MNKFILLLTGSQLLFIITGCTTVKRFRTAEFSGEDNTLVDVQLFNTRLSPENFVVQEKNLWTLSANAQTRMVQILDERYPDNEQFMDAISGSFGTNEVSVQDLTRKDLRMVFSINKSRDYSKLHNASGRFSPADRIEYLRLSLEIPDSYNLRFDEWNRYETEFGELDIADVSFSRSMDLSLDASPVGTDIGYDAGVARNEKQVITKRYLKLNGRMSDHMVVIESEGNRELDLTGNVIIDVSLVFKGFPEIVMIPVFSDAGDGTRAAEIATMKFVDTVVPAMEDAPDTLFAFLSMEYIYRHVASGWETFAEWDDKVEYFQGHVSKKVPLFLKKDYLPGLFCIGTDQGENKSLKFRKTAEKEYLLQFMEYQDASRFLEWLQNPARRQTDPVFIGSHKLLFEGAPVTPGEVVEKQLKVLPVY